MARCGAWSEGAIAVLRRTVAAVGLAALTSVAAATPIPPGFSGDTGAIALGHGNQVFAFQTFSISDVNVLPIYFGFYFDGTGGAGAGGDGQPNIGLVFDPLDDAVGHAAVIDFPNGTVADIEAAALQSLFTVSPSGTGDIGFLMSVLFPGQSSLTTFYSDPALNGGFDLVEIFPLIGDPTTYTIAFRLPSGGGAFTEAYQVLMTGLRPIPVPATWMLAGLGFTLMIPFMGERRSRRQTTG